MAKKPYQDAGELERLYLDGGLSTREIADRLNCSQSTVSRWLNRHGIEREKPWRDEETLRDLYLRQGLSVREVASELGCSKEPVDRAMKELGVPHRDPDHTRPPTFETNVNGYETWRHESNGVQYGVYVHRLAGVAWFGFEGVVGKQIHHKNGVPWDTREGNIKPMTAENHTRLHHSSGGDTGNGE